MTLPRLTAWTLLAAFGFVSFSSGFAAAQDNVVPQKPSTANSELNTLKEKETRGIPADKLPAAKKSFEAFAKYHAAIISHPLVYQAAQDPALRLDADMRVIPTLDSIFNDFQRFIAEPTLANANSVTADRADYIREMGIAVDAALKPVIETGPDHIKRLNAMRLLAAACKSGASAHYPTITELLKNPNTPTDIKHYALQAAGNLLAAYDVTDYDSRRHSNGWKKPDEAEKELGELVGAIEKCILDPAAVLNVPPTWKLSEATLDQLDVARFVRRQAVKALGQVRFVRLPGPDGKPLYPAYTLARVCTSDPTVFPTVQGMPGTGLAPTPSECAEAVIGICNMAPTVKGAPIKEYNDAAAAEAITAALITFSGARAENPQDKSLPWRGYGLRLADAFKNWRPLFDPIFGALKPDRFAPPPASVNELIQVVQPALLAPLDKVSFDGKVDLTGGRVEIEKLKDYLRQLRAKPNRNPLMFTDNKDTALPAPGAR